MRPKKSKERVNKEQSNTLLENWRHYITLYTKKKSYFVVCFPPSESRINFLYVLSLLVFGTEIITPCLVIGTIYQKTSKYKDICVMIRSS